jgi:hypothetical protein
MINNGDSIAVTPPIKQRRIWITVILTLLDPGLGLIYCGNFIGGIILASVLFLFDLSSNNFATSFWLLVGFLVVFLVIRISFIIFNIKYAKRANCLKKPWVKNTWSWIISVFIVSILLGFLTDYIPQINNLQPFKISSGSMENTLFISDYLW